MPNMNGIEFIEKVKKQHPYLKILVISMFQQIISRKMIHGFILKDASSEEFIKAIKEIVIHENSYFKDKSKILIKQTTKSSLTKREKEIVVLIAQDLFLSRTTVETHKKNIFLKLQVKTNAGLIRKALMLGVIN
jgi:DNA-binding NarL/FixJ family response regulator